jgi:3-mercaptopyruvate sulfurtransferase SseA
MIQNPSNIMGHLPGSISLTWNRACSSASEEELFYPEQKLRDQLQTPNLEKMGKNL